MTLGKILLGGAVILGIGKALGLSREDHLSIASRRRKMVKHRLRNLERAMRRGQCERTLKLLLDANLEWQSYQEHAEATGYPFWVDNNLRLFTRLVNAEDIVHTRCARPGRGAS